MIKKLLLTSLLCFSFLSAGFCAITRGATVTTYSYSNTVTSVSFAHTVDASTTLLVLAVTMEADETITTAPYWNTTEAFTLINATTASGSAGDEQVKIYGLINPTTGTHNITYTQSSDDHAHATAVNYLGTATTSVEVATAPMGTKVNNAASTTTVIASGGQTGATLFACAVFFGGDGDTASNATSFTELADSATGTDVNADVSFYVADLIGGAPAGITVDWTGTASDENAGAMIEILTPELYASRSVLDRTKAKLLCHFNGANEATSYTSDDASARTATFYNSAQLSTAQKKFGSASLLLASATSDYITFPDSDDFYLNSDWTIGYRFWFNSLPTVDATHLVVSQNDDTNLWGLYFSSPDGGTTIKFGFVLTGLTYWETTVSVATNQWYSFEISKIGNNYYKFFNGTLIDSETDTTAYANVATTLRVGGGSYKPNGYIDELYIINGQALHTSMYEPLDVEYSLSAAGGTRRIIFIE